MELPQFIVRAIANGSATVGTVLDKLQEMHNRQEGETRRQRGNRPWPQFDRDATRAELIRMFPKLDPQHPRGKPRATYQAVTELRTPLEIAMEKQSHAF